MAEQDARGDAQKGSAGSEQDNKRSKRDLTGAKSRRPGESKSGNGRRDGQIAMELVVVVFRSVSFSAPR